MTMTADIFDAVRQVVEIRSGVTLEKDKEYLLKTQVEPFVETWGFPSLAALAVHLRQEPQGETARKVVESLMPMETCFFRDPAFFEALEKKVFPSLIEQLSASRKLRIWSAACSTGQEPYSVAILLKEKFPSLASWSVKILASDFSRSILTRAKEGLYNTTEAHRCSISAHWFRKYFLPEGPDWRIHPDIRQAVEFREINLKDEQPFQESFDLVLVRNVLIYFDVEAKKKVLSRLHRSLRPQGFLFLGTAETTLYLDKSFAGIPFEGGVTGYRLKGQDNGNL